MRWILLALVAFVGMGITLHLAQGYSIQHWVSAPLRWWRTFAVRSELSRLEMLRELEDIPEIKGPKQRDRRRKSPTTPVTQ
jgi:hypothetical protein